MTQATRVSAEAAVQSEAIHLFGEMGYAAAVQAGVSAAVGDFREAVGLGTKAIRFFEHSKFSQVQYLAYLELPVQGLG